MLGDTTYVVAMAAKIDDDFKPPAIVLWFIIPIRQRASPSDALRRHRLHPCGCVCVCVYQRRGAKRLSLARRPDLIPFTKVYMYVYIWEYIQGGWRFELTVDRIQRYHGLLRQIRISYTQLLNILSLWWDVVCYLLTGSSSASGSWILLQIYLNIIFYTFFIEVDRLY